MEKERNLGFSASRYHELAAFDGDWRDSWWNQDFLELMQRRLELDRVRDLLDVGCGVGHWGQRLATLLAPDTRVVGLDHEPGFLEAAARRARELGRPQRFEYVEGSVERLPFPDETFDLVTCQTVLMHVADPELALREMLRVTRRGGLLVASEPNNLANALVAAMGHPRPPFDETLRLLRFEQLCQAGKIALGQGDRSVGERLPGLFKRLGLERIETYKNDRCPALYPPYDEPLQRVTLEQMLKWIDAEVWSFGGKDDTRRLYVAGGGSEREFEEHWALAMASRRRFKTDVESGEHHAALGFVHYIVSGRRKS